MTEGRLSLQYIPVLCLILSAQSIYGQSLFLDHGQNGFQIDGLYSNGNGANTIGGGFGYSINGHLDIQFAALRVFYPEEEFGPDFSALILVPGAAYHIRKQSEEVPVSLVAALSYGYYKFTRLQSFGGLNEANGSSLNAGLYVLHRFKPEPTVSVIPGIGVTYSNAKLALPNSSGGLDELTDSYFSVSFSIPIAFYLQKGQAINFRPELAYGNTVLLFSMSIGFVVPSNQYPPGPGGS
jgi:hypothetical protein